jgi:tetratricopeptide (TPR) repeat protein
VSVPSDQGGSGTEVPKETFDLAALSRLSELPEDEILEFVREGLITPADSGLRKPVFDWSDLILLKKAKELSDDLALAKVRRALRELVSVLPRDAKLETLRLSTRASELVVHDRESVWVPSSGQILLAVPETEEHTDTLREPAPKERPALALVRPPTGAETGGGESAPVPLKLERTSPAREAVGNASGDEPEADAWFRMGCELESEDAREAELAYERALKLDPGLADAHINLGRLLHEGKRLREAERHYRFALAKRPDDVTASFNLAVLLEDLGRRQDALAAYISTLELDANFADAHYNLARLHERMGHRQHALRHFQIYRQLAGEDAP